MKDMVLLPPTSSPSAANGSRLQCVGEVVTTIKIGHVTRPSVRVLVVDKLNSPAILGVDVLRNYDNMTIDWEAQVLHLGGYSIPLEDRLLGAPRQPTEVCLVSDTVIPARSQCFITAASKDFGTMPQDTMFVPYQDKMAKQNVLLGAGVVVRSIKNEIPILVMNNSASPIKLYNEVGKTDRINFEIDTNNHPPVALKLRRTPFALRDEVDRQIREMEERGVIRESASPWSSPILLVPKKDGSYRFCADFRALNDVTVTDIFPLPSIRECLDSLGGSAMFSTLDLHSGYWQIPIDPKDRHKTAFTTESGHWEFVVMPFGVKNAPAVFSRLMADVMRGLTWNGVAIYLDDIIIGGASFDEHLRLLKEVLSRLRNAGLTIKSSKVHLCQKTLRFLGHLVSVEGPFGPQSTSRGNRYLLVVLDLLTRAAEMIPIPNKTAKTVANAVVTEVFCRHGIPESILTDKGLEFDSSAMLVLATELGIDKKRISALHPQANGAVERLNRTIGQMLKKTQEENDLDWDLKIPFVRFNYLNQEHSSTGYSPFYLTFGRNPRTPVLVKDSSMPKP
ncbi:hypothetical protein QZH41_011945 [Actinostola sp. cb2023]|nr:hypothetical protein QZH41_011945 [Actinostola sp. cb2023]